MIFFGLHFFEQNIQKYAIYIQIHDILGKYYIYHIEPI